MQNIRQRASRIRQGKFSASPFESLARTHNVTEISSLSLRQASLQDSGVYQQTSGRGEDNESDESRGYQGGHDDVHGQEELPQAAARGVALKLFVVGVRVHGGHPAGRGVSHVVHRVAGVAVRVVLAPLLLLPLGHAHHEGEREVHQEVEGDEGDLKGRTILGQKKWLWLKYKRRSQQYSVLKCTLLC